MSLTDDQTLLADVDGSGSVNTRDVMFILRYNAGLSCPDTIGKEIYK